MPKPKARPGIAVRTRRDTDPAWLTLELGVGACEFLVRPLSPAVTLAADAAASHEIRLMHARRADLRKMGQEPEAAELDIDDPHIAYGVWQAAYIRHVARIAVMDWRGVHDEDGAVLAFAAELLEAVMRDPEMQKAFDRKYLQPLLIRSAEKNGSGLASPGNGDAGRKPARAAAAATSPTQSPSSDPPGSRSTATGTAA